jgi:ubiquinone/menaquinone biosynthesis C-methylase UbiE
MTLPGFWDWYAAIGYDALLALAPYAALQADVVDTAACQAGERVLVAGCGTGNFEHGALAHTPELSIEAVDFAPSMLARARRKNAANAAVCYHQADLCATLPFAPASFDVAVMCNVLYALPDPDAALREIARVVKPGGRFVLCDRPPHSHFGPVARAHCVALAARPPLRRLGGWLRTAAVLPALGGVMLANVRIQQRHRDGAYHFFAEDEIRGRLTAAGFAVEHCRPAYADQCWLLLARRTDEEVTA